MEKDGIDTPALLVDLDALDSNINEMREDLASTGCAIRPHIKVHKTPAIAHKQIRAGSVGVTCAKLGEAEVMASSGVRGILIANQIVGRSKVDRLAGLARHTDVMVAIDNFQNAEEISNAARERGSTVGAVIEIDVGFKRAGVQPRRPVSLLAKKIGQLNNLKLAGIMGYEGHLQGVASLEERTRLVKRSVRQLVDSAKQLRRDGFECEIVSTAGTNTYGVASKMEGVTEVQAGTYTVMDTFHSVEGVKFKKALTVLTSVTSTPEPGRAIVDAGLKAFADGTPFPLPKDRGIRVTELSEEHGHLKSGVETLQLGDRMEFYPFYAPTTTNLYDKVYGMRGDHVEVQWQILARGRSQ